MQSFSFCTLLNLFAVSSARELMIRLNAMVSEFIDSLMQQKKFRTESLIFAANAS